MIIRGASSASSAPTLPRSVVWRVSLGRLARGDRPVWARMVAKERARYKQAKRAALEAPDGSFPDGFGGDDSAAGKQEKDSTATASQLNVNNPLSLAQENPWHAHFDKLTALEQIQKDVQRAFPDDEQRFNKGGEADKRRFVQHVSSVLAVWSLQPANAAIGYRQGMHEVAGVCWLVVKEDAEDEQALLRPSNDDDVEADTYAVFDAVMARAASYYVWKPVAGGDGTLPIHQHCEVLEASLLSNDAHLSRHLSQLNIPVSMFAIRWMRLLFLRELPLDAVVELWDALFDIDPSLYLVAHVCVAMLLRIRTQLMAARDNPTALRLMLSYPAEDALHVQGEQETTQADSIRMLLDEARQAHRRHAAVVSGHERVEDVVVVPGGGSAAPAPSLTDIARGLYVQAVAPGLHRAINNVQRTVTAAYAANNSGASVDGFPPSMDALRGSAIRVNGAPSRASTLQPPAVRRPKDGPHAQFEALRVMNKQMGTTMAEVVRVMELYAEEDDGKKATRADYVASLAALKHIRDVLSGQVDEFDPAVAASVVAAKKAGSTPPRSSPPSPTMSRIALMAAPTPPVLASSPTSSSYPPQPVPQPSAAAPPRPPPMLQPSFGSRFPRTTGNNEEATTPVVGAPSSQFQSRAPLTSRLSSVVSRSSSTRPAAATTPLDDPLGAGHV